MQKEQTTIINCHYRDKNDKILFFCNLTHRNGLDFILEIPKEAKLVTRNNSFVCYDGENRIYILQNLVHSDEKSDHFLKSYYFQSLITIPSNIYNGKHLKIKAINFTFPYINAFFYNVDYLKATTNEKNEKALLYKNGIKFKKFNINKKFSFNLNIGYRYGGGRIGGKGGHFDLIKSIKISSEKERPLNEFIEILATLIEFFSICFRRKLLITDIWSEKNENTTTERLEIKTFQFKILDKDYEEDRSPFKNLATYALLQNNFDEIIKKFIKSKGEKYEGFPVFCDLYMRNHDAPDEIYPQMKFLPFMQGIEAYVSKLPCNKDFKLDNHWKKAIKDFKRANPELPNIKELKYQNQLNFQSKINNAINASKINNIIKFKMTTNGSFKLIKQMVKFRNYYTHYGESTGLDDSDLHDVIKYTKIFCEIFIMKELGFTNKQIKISLNNNYYYLSKWDNKYCSLDIDVMPKGYSKRYYLGDVDDFSEQQHITYALFYKPFSENKLRLILKSRMAKEKTKARSIVVDKNISSEEYEKLNKLYKLCYDRYSLEQEQIQYRQHN